MCVQTKFYQNHAKISEQGYDRELRSTQGSGCKMVADIIQRYSKKHEHRLHNLVNDKAVQPLDQNGIVKRLKRTNLLSQCKMCILQSGLRRALNVLLRKNSCY